MSTVAEQLRNARESQGLSIYYVAECTKIRTDHVRALEEGNYDAFAATVYIRGFVRTYATVLKLDVPAVMTALESELSQTEKFAEPPALGHQSRGFLDVLLLQLWKVNWRVALPSLGLAFALLLVILGFRAWRDRQTRDPLADLGPGLYEPTNRNTGDTVPLPPPARK
jgi:cytoskeletal protein RodZ